MKNFLLLIILPLCLLLLSCSDSPEAPAEPTQKTLLMYLPWSSSLTRQFEANIADMEKCVAQMQGTGSDRVLVFLASSLSEAELFEIVWDKGLGTCSRKRLKSYTDPAFTTADGLGSILRDVKDAAPALRYAMIIGGHGMGWLPVSASPSAQRIPQRAHWEYGAEPLTRYFGGSSSSCQTEVETLAQAIEMSVGKMEFILFDACYMGTIEVAYALRGAADYLIASSTEVLAKGMPYATMGQYLLGDTDYQGACRDFYEFYSTYSTPCGALAVVDLSAAADMAALMKEINAACPTAVDCGRLQVLDGYSPRLFYDYGDHVRKLLEVNAAPESLAQRFEAQMARFIPYAMATANYFTASGGAAPLRTYSGLSTSAPSVNPIAKGVENTEWHKATH